MKNMKMIVGSLVLFLVGAVFAGAVVAEDAAPAASPAAAPAAATTAQASPLTIDRMIISESVQDREPVGAAESFSADVGKVYCFIEAKDVKEDTTVSVVWYFHGNQMAKVDLNLKKADRWRTYSSKNLGGLKGDWKVEIQDQNEVILKIAEFKVQ